MTRIPGLTPDQQLAEHEHVERTHRAAAHLVALVAALVITAAVVLATATTTRAATPGLDDEGYPTSELDSRDELAATGLDPLVGVGIALALIGVGVQAARLVRDERARRGGDL